MTDQVIGAHNDLHSEQGALNGEHAGRSANPIIKVQDVIWLEFEKPDLERAEAFAQAFGFSTALRTDEELHLRGCDAGAPCVLIRRGEREKFLGPGVCCRGAFRSGAVGRCDRGHRAPAAGVAGRGDR